MCDKVHQRRDVFDGLELKPELADCTGIVNTDQQKDAEVGPQAGDLEEDQRGD